MKTLIRWVTLLPLMFLLVAVLDFMGIMLADSLASTEMPDSVGELALLIFFITVLLPIAACSLLAMGSLIGMFPIWWTQSHVALGVIGTLFVIATGNKLIEFWGEWWVITYLVLSTLSVGYGMFASATGIQSASDELTPDRSPG